MNKALTAENDNYRVTDDDGRTCLDFDECANDEHYCHFDATCDNTESSFTCTCVKGFSGDGVKCSDIDECLTGSHSCDSELESNSQCGEMIGSCDCFCKNG